MMRELLGMILGILGILIGVGFMGGKSLRAKLHGEPALSWEDLALCVISSLLLMVLSYKLIMSNPMKKAGTPTPTKVIYSHHNSSG